MVEGAVCDPGDNWCVQGRYLKLGHGSMTGKNSHKLSNLTQMSNIHFILFFNALSISKWRLVSIDNDKYGYII